MRRIHLLAFALAAATTAYGQSAPFITGVNSGFGFQPFVSPSGLANIVGRSLADATGFSFGTTRVTVNGVQALLEFILLDAASGLYTITFQMPPQSAVGNGTFIVSRGGVSSAPFSFPVTQFAPQLAGIGTTPFARLQHADGRTLDSNSPAAPGEKVKCVVSGIGPATNPVVPVLTVGGYPTVIESIRAGDPIFNFPGVFAATFVVPPQLGTGNPPMSISLNNLTSSTRAIPVQSTGLSVSQTGVTFRAVAGSTTPLQRVVSVISTSTSITWNATATTVSGGTWLQVAPATGISVPGRDAPTIQVSATVGQLAVGDYYGTVTVRATNVLLSISVVLSVLPAAQSPGPIVEPTGLVFVGSPGTPAPASKTVRISNPTTAAFTFSTTTTSSTATRWFTFSPASGSVPPGTPLSISVQPNARLAEGNYTGSITFSFGDGSQRVVNLLAVLVTGAVGGSGAFPEIGAANCTPTKLFTVFTLLGLNFTSPVAWPSNIDAFVTDDCGTAVTTGAVSVSFSNGDPPLGMLPLQDGHWAATWTPRNPVNANLVVTVTAKVFNPDLVATATLSGKAPANPNVPIVFNGGVVGTASYVASPAPGTLISLFGAELADDLFISPQVPRPTQILTTQVVLGGVNLPLLFVSKGQINALAPYGLKSKTAYSLIVQRGNALSTPETLVVLDSQPGVFTLDLSGAGQGHIYRNTAAGLQILAAPGAAVTSGDVLTVYCAGLGEVNPPSVAGTPARTDVVQRTTNPVTATIGGVAATVQFAGLSPGFTGLYQVNLVVPGGVSPGNAVELVLTSAGQTSLPVTLAVR